MKLHTFTPMRVNKYIQETRCLCLDLSMTQSLNTAITSNTAHDNTLWLQEVIKANLHILDLNKYSRI
jgi:hypothetical protein